ncbi:hypothetical protein M011DRAFT_466563 [Sporormia fimetaria CBS 119925]|uniref:Uncharacterized protein n=1 Tax=Sporormia fimetaria CBS 119925 TaxID=1340428 RepID=A0A6A6VHV5_9PLEO|nr:hypothetical protein M011DRAFT_466563 [Sporormia fimetaria CBS 119925]
METISNVASAASKLVFGDQKTTTEHNETAGQEPISGQQGKGTANEPFDQGNAGKLECEQLLVSRCSRSG